MNTETTENNKNYLSLIQELIAKLALLEILHEKLGTNLPADYGLIAKGE